MEGELSTALVVEVLATLANLAYIVFLIRERIVCWSFGIAGSLLSVYLFLDARLYSESVLYVFYAVMGVWGWLRWHRREEQADNPVVRWQLASHCAAIVAASALALLMGYTALTYTDAQRPMFDAFTTSFSFLATYLEIAKVLEGWIYWFVINVASVWLYHDRELDIYAALIALYSVLSVVGFVRWRRSWLHQQASA
ncbi:MAG: nicotinamide riboside transporter PnuC [Halioglobus sp.]|nr:nicotinamide riboside transporter PnuC [Halioglobus sp.]